MARYLEEKRKELLIAKGDAAALAAAGDGVGALELYARQGDWVKARRRLSSSAPPRLRSLQSPYYSSNLSRFSAPAYRLSDLLTDRLADLIAEWLSDVVADAAALPERRCMSWRRCRGAMWPHSTALNTPRTPAEPKSSRCVPGVGCRSTQGVMN